MASSGSIFTRSKILDSRDRWNDIRSWSKSASVETVVESCENLARAMDPSYGITSTVLLQAIALAGHDKDVGRRSAVAWLATILARNEGYEHTIRDYTRAREEDRKKTATPRRAMKVSDNVASIFDYAIQLALTESGGANDNLEGRHLIAAFLDLPDQFRQVGAWKVLAHLGLDRRVLRDELYRGLAEAPDIAPLARHYWAGLTIAVHDGQHRTSAFHWVPTDRYLPSFDADDAGGVDRLGFGTDVEAMAALIASKTVKPPLSIGVFGDWGSGKSFFVHKLARRVQELGAEDQELFWPNIEVIEFNAWHYVDANLWASLVAHVFDQLRAKTTPEKDELKQQLDNLEVAKAVYAEAEQTVIVAKQRLEKAQAEENRIKNTLDIKRGDLAANIAKDLWKKLQEDYQGNEQVTQAITEFNKISSAGKEVGQDVHTLYTRAQEMATTAGRVKLIGLNLLRGEGTKTILWGFGLATLGAVAVGAFLAKFATPENVAAAIAALTQVGGTAIAALMWIRQNTKRVLASLEPVEKARIFIEGHLREAEEAQTAATARLEAEIAQELVAFKQATQEETEARRKLEEAKQAVQRQVSGELIRRFVEQRAGSGDYAKHLGLIAMIREDFQKLSDMLSTHNRDRASDAAKGVPDQGINRIVLVIDDLDRCPPARVVEVLEAVFLLLAFPAFVVVVAVDSRWVSHSLLRTYDHLLQNGSEQKTEGAENELRLDGRATPRDYLEKIFQIPYRVRRMNEVGYSQMIDALTGGGVTAPIADRKTRQPDQPAIDMTQAAGTVIPRVSRGAEKQTKISVPTKEQSRPTLQAMRLTPDEVTAMKQLSSIVGRSPRATKRFVNIYRLLKASLSPEQLPRFEHEEYRAAMVLLAMAHDTTLSNAADKEVALETAKARLPDEFRAEWDRTVVHFEAWAARIDQFSFES